MSSLMFHKKNSKNTKNANFWNTRQIKKNENMNP